MYVLARSNLTEMLLDVEYMMELMDPALQLGEGEFPPPLSHTPSQVAQQPTLGLYPGDPVPALPGGAHSRAQSTAVREDVTTAPLEWGRWGTQMEGVCYQPTRWWGTSQRRPRQS